MHVATDLLDPPEHPNHPPGRVTRDSDFVRSIESMEILEPILATAEGNRYRIVDGLRRLEAAVLLGMAEVPIHVAANLPGPHALAAGVTVNTQREPMPPTQQWRALAALEAQGMPLDRAAAYLGMDVRHARRLAKLGQLHPEILEAIASIEADPAADEYDHPDDSTLRHIASAPLDVQLAAYRAHISGDDGTDWDRIATRCKVRRISAEHAIFDRQTAGVLFEEDLFAQPGTADQFTTSDIDGFIAAQRLALATLVDTLKPKKRWHLTEQDGPAAAHQIGMQPMITHGTRPRLTGDEHCFGYVLTGGWEIGQVRWTVAIPKAGKATPEPDELDDEDPAESDVEPDEDPGEDHAPPPPMQPTGDIRPLTKAGQTLVAKAKTQALADALHNQADVPHFRQLVAFLILAFHARNVSATTTGTHLRDGKLAVFRALIDPAGQLVMPDDTTLASLATSTLATVLSIDDPAKPQGVGYDAGSGEVAEWIGHAIAAGAHLPRMDTEAMLKEATGDTLRSAAIATNGAVKATGMVADLRRLLQGHAETWRPPGSDFGAPGPKPLPADRRRPAPDMEDAA